jgi:ribonuclease HII
MNANLRRDSTAPLTYEHLLRAQGYTRIAGLDEAGRGPWAGPVAAAAVILPDTPDLLHTLKGARDSKQMTPRQREHMVGVIQEHALTWGIGSATADEIDQLGLNPAILLAFNRALAQCHPQPDFLLLDYVRWPQAPLPYEAIKRGDRASLSIACASILAKTWRDQHMRELHTRHPEYGFAAHKGYGTALHQAAIARCGVLRGVHRTSYKPVRQALGLA